MPEDAVKEDIKKELSNADICTLLGGEIEDDMCRIPEKYYKSASNCNEMYGKVSDEGSCDIPIKYMVRLRGDNRYTD